MLEHNDFGKVVSGTFRVVPTGKAEEAATKWFNTLTEQQRAEAILISRETLSRIYQRNADVVTG